MTHSPRDLTALLGSRICHDLISPLGAISNGVELLSMSDDMSGPEMSLIGDSVSNANARIRFFRIAFGVASEGQLTANTEVKSILSDLTQAGRLKYAWNLTEDQLRADVKLAFLFLMCLETAMPFGGQIAITVTDGKWQIAATADKLKIDTDLWGVLSNPNSNHAITPAQVQFALIPHELRELGKKLSAELRETAIDIQF